MQAMAPIAEFTRNQSAVIDELERTGEPLCLTRNGRASVVVMSVAAYDRLVGRVEETRALEEEVRVGVMAGYKDALDGKVSTLEDVDARIRARKGW